MSSFLRNKFIKPNIVVFGLLSALVTFFIFYDTVITSNSILLLFVYISISSLFGVFLSKDQAPFSLNKTYHIFILFFFGLAPVLQYKSGIVFLGAPALEHNDYLKTVILIAIAHSLYLVLYHISRKHFICNFKLKKMTLKDKDIELIHVLYILSLLALIAFLILVKFDIDVIFKRPPNHWQKENTRFGLIGYSLLLIVRAIPLLCFLTLKLISQNNKISHLTFLFILTIFTAFPLSLGRGTLVFYYLPIIILFIPIFKRKFTFSLSFILGVFFVFPILNFFRPNGTVDLGFKQFLTPHFDAFHNFSLLLKENVVTNGEQLLGSFLFFVPSSIWKNRPVGTGQMIAEKLDFSYTNVSMPFLGEGYANFGYFGIFISVVFLVLLNSFFDGNYDRLKNNYFFKIIFLFLLGFEFYLLRGDLYSSVKLSVSYLLALLFVFLVIKTTTKFNIRH